MARHLFIVARQQPDLYAHLAREFSEEPDVRVILDRRQGDRRQRDRRAEESADRRHSDRRTDTEMGVQLSTLGYAFVRV